MSDKCPNCGHELRVAEGNWGCALVYCKYCGFEEWEERSREKVKRKMKGKESKWI